MICPKCNHNRTDEDRETPEYQCPSCGVIYAKYTLNKHNGTPKNQETKNTNILQNFGNSIIKALSDKPDSDKHLNVSNDLHSLYLAQIELQRYKTNHVLHLLLSLAGGLWLPVWLVITAVDTGNRNAIYKRLNLPKESNTPAVMTFVCMLIFSSAIILAII